MSIVAAIMCYSCCISKSTWFKSLLMQRMLSGFVSRFFFSETFSWNLIAVVLRREFISLCKSAYPLSMLLCRDTLTSVNSGCKPLEDPQNKVLRVDSLGKSRIHPER